MEDTQILAIDHPNAIPRACDLIQAGGVIAFPTDTVYGIGVSAFQIEAIEKIYRAKGRSTLKAIPILLGDLEAAQQVTPRLSPAAQALSEAFWPGPLTLVLPLLPSLPGNLSPSETIGLRIPNHPFTLALLRETGPLAATSANVSGQPSAISAAEVQSQLGSKLDLILDGGRSPGGRASTVLDCTAENPVVLREGPLTWDEIQTVLGESGS